MFEGDYKLPCDQTNREVNDKDRKVPEKADDDFHELSINEVLAIVSGGSVETISRILSSALSDEETRDQFISDIK